MIFKTMMLHEISRNMRLARYWILSSLALSLFTLSSLHFTGHYHRQGSEHDRMMSDLRQSFSEMRLPTEIRVIAMEVVKGVDSVEVINFGEERLIPAKVHFNLVEDETREQFIVEKNLLSPYPRHIDWIFVVTYCLSLAAILHGYDLVSGELVQGTLKLVLVNPLSRASWLAAKLLGTLSALCLPVLLGTCIGVLILIAAAVPVGLDELLLYLTALLSCALLLTALLVSAAALSALSRSNSVSLILGMLLWFTLVLILPGLSRSAATLAYTPKQRTTVEDKVREAHQRSMNFSNSPDAGTMERSLDQFRQERRTIKREHLQTVLKQVGLARLIGIASPLNLYRRSVEAISDGGLERHDRFLRQIRSYMQRLWERSKNMNLTGGQVQGEVFQESRPSSGARIASCLPFLFGLLLLSLLGYFACFVVLARLQLT
ncbi:MAG TPA: ABC transporter permease [Acidobacteriota bacterium]|nr:ABC transporter permease [Acidobacteriota bacterium]